MIIKVYIFWAVDDRNTWKIAKKISMEQQR